MIVVAFVLALVAGLITLQVLTKTLRVPPVVSIAAGIVVGLADSGGGLAVQIVHLMLASARGAPPRVAPDQRGTGRRHRRISPGRPGWPPAAVIQQRTVANSANSSRSPLNASDAGIRERGACNGGKQPS